MSSVRQPQISVVIPTHQRARLLSTCLLSLAGQRLALDAFEVIVVDDGSTDETGAIATAWPGPLNLRYQHIERSGIAVAKNVGLALARAPLVLFFDDDDAATPRLLLEHLLAHDEHPDEVTAILGYTTWSSSLRITEVMRFVTDIGHHLFEYDGLEDGQVLDYTYFWGGRASCKRSMLIDHGIFHSEFTFGSEDTELAYRLSRHGFRVVFKRHAAQEMMRVVTLDDFCLRSERQGRSYWQFSQMHPDAVIREMCLVDQAMHEWPARRPQLQAHMVRGRVLERLTDGGEGNDTLISEYHQLLWWLFDTMRFKGLVEEMERSPQAPQPGYRASVDIDRPWS